MGRLASLLWRGKFGLIVSIGLNILLAFLLLKTFLTHKKEQIEFLVNRREVGDRSAYERFQSSVKNVKCYIFILILSAPGVDAAEKRKTIRETWLSLPIPDRFKKDHRFVIGTYGLSEQQKENLFEENKKHQDLLMLSNHKDSYPNLTLKLLKSFIWTAKNVHSNFVLKVDDDSFVRIPMLIENLDSKQKFDRIYWGYFRGDANVKKIGKWAEKNWILCDKYLPYANGGGYLLSQDLVVYIAKNADMLQIFNSEDVSVGAWLAPVLINRVHDVRFDTEYKSRGCNNKHIISHKQSIIDMDNKYKQIMLNNKLCQEESLYRKSFDYDWRVPPSQCCKRIDGIP